MHGAAIASCLSASQFNGRAANTGEDLPILASDFFEYLPHQFRSCLAFFAHPNAPAA